MPRKNRTVIHDRLFKKSARFQDLVAGVVADDAGLSYFWSFVMSLKQRLTEDMKNAMRAGDKSRLGVIRLILAAIKQREVDERIELDDTQVLTVLEKMLKQRRDSITQFDAANRTDLADIERAEVEVIGTYLPEPLSDAEVASLLDAAIAESGATSPRDMGKVMAILKERAAGRADMAALSKQVKARLA